MSEDGPTWSLYRGKSLDVLRKLEDLTVDCTVTSPPYFALRDYDTDEQYGHETMAKFVENLQELFSVVRDRTAKHGTLWMNLGDTYNSYPANRSAGSSFSKNRHTQRMAPPSGYGLIEKTLPNKSLLGVPWRTAIALQEVGWILRNAIIWQKTSPSPERVRDRLTRSYEHVFFFSRSERGVFFDTTYLKSISDTRNPLDVWTFPAAGRLAKGLSHPALYPVELPRRCIGLGCPPGGLVLDPFTGSSTTGVAALELDRNYVGIDSSAAYLRTSVKRLEPLVPRAAIRGNRFGVHSAR